MNRLPEHLINCPYCGESFTLFLELSQGNHHTVEDCYACCRPINILIESDGEQLLRLECGSDDETLF